MDLFNYLSTAHQKILTTYTMDEVESQPKILAQMRTEAFKIQAFGRIIKRAGKKSSDEGQMIRTLGENLKSSSKFIEDTIGELLYHHEMSSSIKESTRLEEALLRFSISKSDFKQHLEWIERSLEILQNLDLKALYLKGLPKELKKIHEDLPKIDPSLLEDGTHELRRKIRWVIMYIVYPKGIFTYKEKDPHTNEYTKLEVVKNTTPIKLSFENINFLSTFVYDLGVVKDEGLKKNYFKTKSEINSSEPHIIELTNQVLNSLKKDNPILKIRSEIKEQF